MAVEWTGNDVPAYTTNVNGNMHHTYRIVGENVEVGDEVIVGAGRIPRHYTLTLCELWLQDAGSATTVDPKLYKQEGASEDTLSHIVSNGSGPVANFRVQTWIYVASTEGISALVIDPGLDATCDRLEIEVTVIEGHAR